MVKALLAAKVPAQALTDRQPVRGDIRDNERCVPAHVLTALDLVADPENVLAWRCWCGYGDWLANSSALANLRAYADEHDKGLVEALRDVQDSALAANEGDADRVVGAKRVADAREAALHSSNPQPGSKARHCWTSSPSWSRARKAQRRWHREHAVPGREG